MGGDSIYLYNTQEHIFLSATAKCWLLPIGIGLRVERTFVSVTFLCPFLFLCFLSFIIYCRSLAGSIQLHRQKKLRQDTNKQTSNNVQTFIRKGILSSIFFTLRDTSWNALLDRRELQLCYYLSSSGNTKIYQNMYNFSGCLP